MTPSPGSSRAASPPSFSPHDCRRTFATTLIERGAEVVTVSQLLGHASADLTARLYDKRPEARKAKAVELFALPLSA